MSETKQEAPAAWQVGQRAVWLYTPRGGYGYTRRVPVVIEKVGGTLIRVRAPLEGGGTAVRRVRPENLRPEADPS